MELQEITAMRLRHQLVSQSTLTSPHKVVQWMGAMQAQDYRSSLWAIGLRMSSAVAVSEAAIEQAVVEKKIVRTWPMRGTLHWVAAEDVRWMLRLLAPRIIKSSQGRHKQLELDEGILNKSRLIFEKSLEDGKQLTRAEIYNLLEQEGILTHGQRGIHIIGHWAMKGVICQGVKRDKNDTFVLLDEWLPPSQEYAEEEALAILAERYIESHGPATEYDFASWAGLKVSDARLGLGEAPLERVTIEGNTFWLFPKGESSLDSVAVGNTWLLPAFDEMLCGYRDRTALLPSIEIKSIILKNGIFKPIIVVDNRAVGIWQRIIKGNKVVVGFSFFHELSKQKKQLIIDKAQSLEGFFEKEIVID